MKHIWRAIKLTVFILAMFVILILPSFILDFYLHLSHRIVMPVGIGVGIILMLAFISWVMEEDFLGFE